jgi:tyrosyl-DNA phosphodiesterase-1
MIGSHNLSKAAWGEQQSGNSSIFIRSFELSVLFLPHLEASYRRSSHHGFQCAPTGGTIATPLLRCPVPPTSGNLDTAASTKVLFRAALQDIDASTRCASTDVYGAEVVPVPIPYRLPPARYGGADVPWAVDAEHSGKDIRGLEVEESWALSAVGLSEESVAAYFQENN